MKGVSPNLRNVRARIARTFIALAVSGLALIAFRLQVLQSSKYALQSDRNRLRKITIPAPRGLILDREGRLLADNIPSYALYLIPFQGDSTARILRRLETVLPLGEKRREELAARLSGGSYRPVKVADNVDISVRSFLEEHRGLIPGLLIRSEPLRYYRYGRECSHVIGYVGETNPADLRRLGGAASEEWAFVGRDGLELVYDESLRGRPGYYFVEVDARGREIGPFGGKEPIRPQRGSDLTLTIDLDLQLEANRLFPEGHSGAVVCLDPRNGEILAMVSRPDYEPNALVTGISSEEWNEMMDDPGSPLFDRACQAGYPPGSTFKPAVALMALESGLVDLHSREPVPCLGGIWYGNRWFGCWKEEGHGSLDLYHAIVQSCDTYFYQLGIRIGLDDLLDGARRLGFADLTGVDLPHESKGFVPDRAWYDRRYGSRGWGKGVALNLAIGQGELLVTPLRLAAFYARIAGDGSVVHPHLIRGEERPDDGGGAPLPSTVLDPLRQALAGVGRDEHGTAHHAAITVGVDMAGKTGTAQNPHGDDHSLFVGYAPPERPEILAVAVIEGAGHGSSVAAPLVGHLLRFYLEGSEDGETPGRGEGG